MKSKKSKLRILNEKVEVLSIENLKQVKGGGCQPRRGTSTHAALYSAG